MIYEKGVLLFATFACILSMNMISFGATSEKNDSLEKNRVLISYDRVDNGDDTYTIERTYRHINSPEKKLTQSVESSLLARGNTYGSDTRKPKGNTTKYNHYVTISCNYKGSDSGSSR